MAVGDAIVTNSSITTGSYVDIKPSGTAEWVIHNVMYSDFGVGGIEFYFDNGTNETLFDKDLGKGARLGLCWHVTSGEYIAIKNAGASSGRVRYDGVVTK